MEISTPTLYNQKKKTLLHLNPDILVLFFRQNKKKSTLEHMTENNHLCLLNWLKVLFARFTS